LRITVAPTAGLNVIVAEADGLFVVMLMSNGKASVYVPLAIKNVTPVVVPAALSAVIAAKNVE